MSRPQILGFLIDDENEEKFAMHGLKERQVRQVLESEFVIQTNRRSRRGLFLVIGEDFGGACIANPIESTHDSNLWRPITAWPCKPSEFTILHRGG